MEVREDPFDGLNHSIPLVPNQHERDVGHDGQEGGHVLIIFRTRGGHAGGDGKSNAIHQGMEAIAKDPPFPIRCKAPGRLGIKRGERDDSGLHLFLMPYPAFGPKQALINESGPLAGKPLIEGDRFIRNQRDHPLQDGGKRIKSATNRLTTRGGVKPKAAIMDGRITCHGLKGKDAFEKHGHEKDEHPHFSVGIRFA